MSQLHLNTCIYLFEPWPTCIKPLGKWDILLLCISQEWFVVHYVIYFAIKNIPVCPLHTIMCVHCKAIKGI